MTNRGKIGLVLGMIILGLSPSFIDWLESPDLRGQIMVYYAVAVSLIVAGLWDGG